MEILNTLLFWAAASLSVVTVYKMYLSRRGKPAEGPAAPAVSQRTQRVLLAVIIVVAVLVRVYRFGGVPGGFNQDGAMAAVDAKALADYGTDRLGMRYPVHLTAWGFGQMSALLSYLMAPLIKLFGLSPIVARLPQLAVSLAGLWCLYLFARNVFGQAAGLSVFAFAAVAPWHILQSRWALDCNLFPHFFVFGLLFLERAAQGIHRKGFLCLSMVFYGLCMYCYGVAIYTVPLFLLAACVYLLWTRRVSWGEAGLALGIYLLVAGPFILVMAINTFGWESIETPLFTLPRFPDSVRSQDILFFAQDIPAQLLANLRSLLNVTLFQVKDLPWNDVEGFGTLYLVSMPFAFAGGFGLAWDFGKKPGAVLTWLFLLTGVWCGVITANVNVNRINIIYYPLILLVGLGIYEAIRFISLPRLAWGLGAGYVLLFCLFSHTYFTTYAHEIDAAFFGDFTRAVSSLRGCGAEHIYISPDGARDSGYIAELLTLFFHEVDAEYYQGKTTPPGEPPYREKYRYQEAETIPLDPGEDAAYLLPAWAAEQAKGVLPEGEYHYERFGGLYAVWRD